MKILYVHERLGALGGAETNAVITATELGKRGHTIGLLHGPSTGKGEAGWHSAFPHRFALDSRASARPTTNAIAEFDPDVVYVHKMADLKVLETLVNSGLPLVRMVHDHDIYCMRSYKYGVFSRKICDKAFGPHCIIPCGAVITRDRVGRFPIKLVSYFDKAREIELCKRFDRMLVVTNFMRGELLKNGFNAEKIEIYPPVPRMGDTSIRGSFSDRNLIIYAGQIIRGKGVDVLLRALAEVKTKFECIILGDGNHKAECERLAAQLKLTDRVQFKGFVPQDELKSYYRDCSLIAISSVWPEPIATIGIEVMRYALPVVAFDAGGIKDWLQDGHNGFLVPWMDHKTYAQRIDTLLNDKELARQMGERGLALANREYDFDSYIVNLEGMFQGVIREKTVRRPAPLAPALV
ncbi:MAG TPA: glycosyltransferase family 4 protein [Methylomirabilota bacterium]|nr:glycosyltransferase family 4 protein [Methylomirabilota bacterium]